MMVGFDGEDNFEQVRTELCVCPDPSAILPSLPTSAPLDLQNYSLLLFFLVKRFLMMPRNTTKILNVWISYTEGKKTLSNVMITENQEYTQGVNEFEFLSLKSRIFRRM